MKRSLSIILFSLLGGLCYPAEQQTFTVTGRVIDYQTRPVQAAIVMVYDEADGAGLGRRVFAKMAEMKTSSDGRFVVHGQTEGSTRWLVAYKPGLALSWVQPTYGCGCNVILRLGKPKPLGGTFVDETGRPLSGARIRLCLKNERMADKEIAPLVPESWFTTQTDARGQFRFDNIPEGTTGDFGVEASGKSPVWTFCDFGLQEGEHYAVGHSDIRITLPAEARIEGLAVDEGTRDPVSGLQVLARPYGRPGWDYCQEPAATDPNGRFVVAVLTPGAYLLEVVPAEGQLQDWFSTNPVVTVGPGQVVRDVRLTVNKAARLEVLVHDFDTDVPLEGAQITASCYPFKQTVVTDANGLAWLHVPPGKCTISGWKPRHGGLVNPKEVELSKGQTHREELLFPRLSVSMSGTVLGPDGCALSQAFVACWPYMISNYADANGQFEIKFYHSMPFPSSTFLVARHESLGLGVFVKLEDPSRSGCFKGQIRLEPAYSLTGRVTDPDGVGIPAAYVRLLPASSSQSPSRWGTSMAEVVTDASGVYHVRGVPLPGSLYCYGVAAYAPGFNESSLEPVPLEGSVEKPIHLESIVLQPANQTISGIVFDANDRPVPGALVETPSFDSRNDNTQPHRHVLSDAHGRFHIDGVCQGPLQISALSPQPSREKGVTHTSGGENHVKIVLGKTLTFAKSLVGTRLPSWEELQLAGAWTDLDDKAILLCLVDIEQRPCRHFLKQLAQRMEEIARHDVAVRIVQAAKCAPGELEKWPAEFGGDLPVPVITGNPEDIRRALGIQFLPWLILTDRQHVVREEGFGLDELSQKIEAIVEKED